MSITMQVVFPGSTFWSVDSGRNEVAASSRQAGLIQRPQAAAQPRLEADLIKFGVDLLIAILRNSLRFKARKLHFAQRNETFRTRDLKPLESLRTANQPFRGFLCYQGLVADFVSLRSRTVRSGPPPATKWPRICLRALVLLAPGLDRLCCCGGHGVSFAKPPV